MRGDTYEDLEDLRKKAHDLRVKAHRMEGDKRRAVLDLADGLSDRISRIVAAGARESKA